MVQNYPHVVGHNGTGICNWFQISYGWNKGQSEWSDSHNVFITSHQFPVFYILIINSFIKWPNWRPACLFCSPETRVIIGVYFLCYVVRVINHQCSLLIICDLLSWVTFNKYRQVNSQVELLFTIKIRWIMKLRSKGLIWTIKHKWHYGHRDFKTRIFEVRVLPLLITFAPFN